MKKHVFFLLAVALSLAFVSAASAKDYAYQSGNVFLSGATNLDLSFGADSTKPDRTYGFDSDSNVTVFGFGTRVGYFVVKGFEIGLGFDYNYRKDTVHTTIETTDTDGNTIEDKYTADIINQTYLPGIQGAYFIDTGGIDPFFMALVGYAGSTYDVKPKKGDKVAQQLGGVAWDVAVGVNFLINPKVGIAPQLFYRGDSLSGKSQVGETNLKQDIDTQTSRYGFRIAVFLFL